MEMGQPKKIGVEREMRGWQIACHCRQVSPSLEKCQISYRYLARPLGEDVEMAGFFRLKSLG
jgi:hypothetical protein